MPQSPAAKPNALQDYITVAERIEHFYERYPEGRLITHIIEHDAERGFILMRAEVYRHADDAMPAATGHAFEVRSEGYVQRTSYIEVCETSSVGRALALCGFEVKRGIAHREIAPPAPRPEASKPYTKPQPPPATKEPAAPPPVKKDQPASEEQKERILKLLQKLRPGDRKAQHKLLVEMTGKDSRDDLTAAEAQKLIAGMERDMAEGSI